MLSAVNLHHYTEDIAQMQYSLRHDAGKKGSKKGGPSFADFTRQVEVREGKVRAGCKAANPSLGSIQFFIINFLL